MKILKINKEYSKGSFIIISEFDLYLFQENDVVIAYCPVLDISAYGCSDLEAQEAFLKSFEMYIDHCIEENTLSEDLKKNGWYIINNNILCHPPIIP